jgi:hypothetical protein
MYSGTTITLSYRISGDYYIGNTSATNTEWDC